MNDLRFALRQLLKSPGFTAVVVLTLALGIGANTTIFSITNGLLLRPLPVREAERLVALFTTYEKQSGLNGTSYPDYRDLRDRNDVFEGLAAHFYFPMALRTADRAEVVMGHVISWNYFEVLGVSPGIGRAFLPEEDQAPGARPVAMLSHRLWQSRLLGDPEVIGKTVLVNGRPFTVVGIVPDFTSLCTAVAPDVWVPVAMIGQALPYPINLEGRFDPWLNMVGRLKQGVSLPQAQAAMKVLGASLRKELPGEGDLVRSFTLMEAERNRLSTRDSTDGVKRIFALLSAVAGVVLLIACFNIANLQLARAMGRQREIALRLSLGASPGRVVRQLLTESLLLGLCGAAAGLALGRMGVDLLLALRPEEILTLDYRLGLDERVLAFTLGLTFLATALFGLLPAWQTLRTCHFRALKDTSATGAGPVKVRLQRALVVSQVALALVLLVSAGLFLRSLTRTLAVAPGFDTRQGIVAVVDLGFGPYDEAQGRQFWQRLLDQIRALPGVESAALAVDMPLGQLGTTTYTEVPGHQYAPGENRTVRRNAVSEGYFKTFGVRILQGRGIESQDAANGPRVMVVNETMARRYWPGGDALGRTIRANDQDWTVIGIAQDGKYDRLSEAPQPYLYQAVAQSDFVKRLHLHVRTTAEPKAWIPAVARTIRDLDPNLPPPRVLTVPQFLEQAVDAIAGPVQIVGAFGVLALALAMVGVYGVMAYTVNQRTREFGVRIALGASARGLLGLVLSQGLWLTGLGTVLGLVGAMALSRLLASLLYEISPWDPLTLVVVTAGLLGSGALACYLPARRAAKVDPVVALRTE
ncbi:MAG: ABC transporter permease [Verrucomicrobiia bacterium]